MTILLCDSAAIQENEAQGKGVYVARARALCSGGRAAEESVM